MHGDYSHRAGSVAALACTCACVVNCWRTRMPEGQPTDPLAGGQAHAHVALERLPRGQGLGNGAREMPAAAIVLTVPLGCPMQQYAKLFNHIPIRLLHWARVPPLWPTQSEGTPLQKRVSLASQRQARARTRGRLSSSRLARMSKRSRRTRGTAGRGRAGRWRPAPQQGRRAGRA
jgi:hypothetical protein